MALKLTRIPSADIVRRAFVLVAKNHFNGYPNLLKAAKVFIFRKGFHNLCCCKIHRVQPRTKAIK